MGKGCSPKGHQVRARGSRMRTHPWANARGHIRIITYLGTFSHEFIWTQMYCPIRLLNRWTFTRIPKHNNTDFRTSFFLYLPIRENSIFEDLFLHVRLGSPIKQFCSNIYVFVYKYLQRHINTINKIMMNNIFVWNWFMQQNIETPKVESNIFETEIQIYLEPVF